MGRRTTERRLNASSRAVRESPVRTAVMPFTFLAKHKEERVSSKGDVHIHNEGNASAGQPEGVP